MQHDRSLLALVGLVSLMKGKAALRVLPALVLFGACPALTTAQYSGQATLVGSGFVSGSGIGLLSSSVAVSADGNTALVGQSADNQGVGTFWVFVRSNGTWTQQGLKLTASDASGTSDFGDSVALSSDGSTALVGGNGDAEGIGASWIFTRANGVWTQQGSKLVGSGAVGLAHQGSSVSLSADGNTALVGGNSDNNGAGAAWIFTRSNSAWTQQGSKLSGAGGATASLSGDAKTAAVGGTGGVSIFAFSNGAWTQQGSNVRPNNAANISGFGSSLSLAADGNTLVVGAPASNVQVTNEGTYRSGEVFVFTRTNGAWSEASDLFGTLTSPAFGAMQGTSVAISSDARIIVETGGGGQIWFFQKAGNSWFQISPEQFGGVGFTGAQVALSANGLTALEAVATVGSQPQGAFVYQYTQPSTQAYVTAQTPGAARNNFSGFVGFAFTIGATPLQVTSLGRIKLPNNQNTHALKLVQASNGVDVPGGSVSLSLTSGTPGQYIYAPLTSPVTLQANTQYFVLSQEIAGGDQWYDYGPVTTANVAADNGPEFNDGSHYVLVSTLPSYAYGPVNFQYTGSGPAISATITAPQNGATIAGNSAPISVTTTGTVGFLQLQIDGNNIGTSVFVSAGQPPPASIPLDTTKVIDGSHTVTVVVTDLQSQLATSPPRTLVVDNFSFGSPYLTGQSPGAARNNFSGFVGLQFTVGSVPLKISSLGRFSLAGNSGSHLIKLVQRMGIFGADVPGGSVSVSMLGATPGQYQYGALASPVTLAANTTYYVLSQETMGGDQWYDYGSITAASVASEQGPAYQAVGNSGYNLVGLPNFAYGPINFQYMIDTSAISISITSPQNGASLSGTFPVTVSTTGTVASVQLQLNGQNAGNPSTTSPFTISLDTTAQSDGQYTLTAVASDGQGHSVSSLGTAIAVSNSPSGTNPSFVTTQNPGGVRNNFTGFVGFAFAVGSSPLQVSSLGRLFVNGNTGMHLLKLVQAGNSADVAGGSVAVSMTGGTAGQYRYGLLASPVTLSANMTYYLLSQETSGGDQWYDYGPIAFTNVAGVTGPAFRDTGGSSNPYIVVSTLPGYSYGPLNFTYSSSATVTGNTLITSQSPGAARNNFKGYVGFGFTVGATPITVSSLGRMDVAGNSNVHLLLLVNASTGVEVPGGEAFVAMAGGIAGQYKYAPLSSPVTLSANTTYYLVSMEASGGDLWFDYGPVTATGAATLKGPAYQDTGVPNNPYNVVTTLPNYAYGPVNLIYQ